MSWIKETRIEHTWHWEITDGTVHVRHNEGGGFHGVRPLDIYYWSVDLHERTSGLGSPHGEAKTLEKAQGQALEALKILRTLIEVVGRRYRESDGQD